MAICGYNAKIGAGLNLLIEGMATSMEEKSHRLGALNALNDELFELREMIRIMEGHGPIQQIFIGLNNFAERFFLEVRQRIIDNPELTITKVMEDIGPKFISTIKYAEEYRSSLNEPHLIERNDLPIHLVANWVNDNASKILDSEIEAEAVK
jgi:hypothetical protein